MDCGANSDLFFLQDEKFDFDVSLSPASSKGDEGEDEVFVGPVSHKERCASVNVASRGEERGAGERASWSPLTGDQLEAVCQEAHRLASQLQGAQPQSTDAAGTGTVKEQFLQDAEAKMDMLGQTARALSPIKRQTFCVQDSPMKQLPPAIQRHMLKRSCSSAASSTRPAATARLSTSSPVGPGARAQPRAALRGRAPLGVAVVLPSKPVAPTAAFSASKSRGEKSRLQPPSKAAGVLRRSPSSRSSNRAESYEDLLSDSASVASDVSDCSLNSSLLGKRTLAPPTKSVGVRNLSGVKASGPQSRRMTDRKNTSSSSSSVSSFNSSLSLSPKGKLNSSLNRSLSSSTGPAPSSVSRPANHSRPRRSTVFAAAEPAPPAAGRRSLSVQAKKMCEGERVKATMSTSLKKAEATPLQPTPSKRPLERTTSITAPGRPQGGLKPKPKPEALVLPTPNTAGRGVRRADDVSKVLKPKRLMSTSSTDSLPQRPSAGPLTPSAGTCRALQVKARRPSALPTPVRRRTLAVPAPTSQTLAARPPAVTDSDSTPTSSSARKRHKCSAVPKETVGEESIDPPDIQPFCLEEEEATANPPSNAEEPSPAESVDLGEVIKTDSVPTKNLIELESTEESASKTQEVLLLDLPAPALQPQEKLLIDLTNTPDLIRTSAKSCIATQLIDLSSPLIKWSPEDKRENNNAPLINLSF